MREGGRAGGREGGREGGRDREGRERIHLYNAHNNRCGTLTTDLRSTAALALRLRLPLSLSWGSSSSVGSARAATVHHHRAHTTDNSVYVCPLYRAMP